MNNMIILLNSLLENSPSPSYKESYGISIPSSIDLSDTGSFQISLTQNNLSEKDSIVINVDKNFILSDRYGKPNIVGSTTNNEITFTSNDTSPKTVSYEINDVSAGSWQGSLNINIDLQTQSEPAVLATGSSIQKKLNKLKPVRIIFSHDKEIDGTYYYDISANADESIKVYKNDDDVIITNMKNEKIMANTNMSSLFKNLSTLTSIENIDYLDMSSCNNMSYMFSNCYNLTSLDLSSFDVSNITNMAYAFNACNKCTSLGDITNWDVANVESFQRMFYCCFKLNNIKAVENWHISNKCTNLSNMFAYACFTSGTSDSSFFPSTLDLTNWDVSNVTNMSSVFTSAFNLETIDISNWNCANVTNMDYMFAMEDTANTSKLCNIVGIDNLNIPNATKTNMFNNCNNLSIPSWYQ